VPSWLSLGILWLNRECILPECSAALDPIETTDMTTGETTSHPTKQPEDGCQVVGYSHLTKLANYANQVIGYSHSTRLSKDDNQVVGYVEEADKIMPFDLDAGIQKSGSLFACLMGHGRS